MYSFIALLLTGLQMGIALVSYALGAKGIFMDVVIYGSPFYLMSTILTDFSIILDKNPLYLLILLFHIVKYFIIFKAQTNDDGGIVRTSALVLEAAYLGLSAYYMMPV